jgi:hypothetical protein
MRVLSHLISYMGRLLELEVKFNGKACILD